MHRAVGLFIRDESATTAIEYGFIVAMLACLVVLAVHDIGANVAIKLLATGLVSVAGAAP